MKVRATITLSPESLGAVDQIAGNRFSRSQVIESAIREFVEAHRRRQREARDLEILDRQVDELNLEMDDVLGYQVEM